MFEGSRDELGQGLFRLWIVAAVIWISAIGFGQYPQVSQQFAMDLLPEGFELEVPVDCKLTVGLMEKQAKREPEGPWIAHRRDKDRRNCLVAESLARLLLPQYAGLSRADLADTLDAQAETKNAPWPRPWDRLWTALSYAFVPPFLLLIFGSALLWAIRGFRH